MIEIFFALSPVIILLVLLIIIKMPAVKAMPIAWLKGVLIAVGIWQVPNIIVWASAVKGAMIALEILLIVLGAIFLLELLKGLGFVRKIDSILKKLCTDSRIHVIIIAWSFSSLIEGVAGFGTSAALSAPLLVGLGVAKLPAVIVSLIANSTPVSFGAMGTPVLLGIKGGVSNIGQDSLSQITHYTAIIHSIIGLFIPLLICCIHSKFGKEKSFKKGLEVWPFAIFAGASFVIPYFLTARFLGPEFPSVIGGLAGFLAVIAAAWTGFLIPKKYRCKEPRRLKPISIFVTLSPYLLVSLLLFITRTGFIREKLKRITFSLPDIFGTGISQSFHPLLSPGIIFLIVAIGTALIFRDKNQILKASGKTISKMLHTFIALSFTIALVQLLINSGSNSSGFDSMIMVVANGMASYTGKFFIFLSPFIGVFGAFLAGSNTVSNILFASFQQETALVLGLPAIIILALQNIGGAIGNMIATHNIIAASATVNLKGAEGKVITYNVVPAIMYAMLAGLLALVIIMVL